MNRAEIVDLLTYCAINDNRTVGDSDVLAWFDMLAPIPLEQAIAAARRHYRTNPDVWLRPGHLWQLCRTTTDLSARRPLAVIRDEGLVLCGSCKLVHRPDEHCDVLVADDAKWRRALSSIRHVDELEAAPKTEAEAS